MASWKTRAVLFGASTLALAEAGGSLKLAWNDCGGGFTPGTVKSLKPDVVVLGSKTTVTGSGTCTEDVPGGTFEIALKASIISQTYTGDLCSPKSFSLPLGTGTIAWDGVKCPIAAGTVDIPVDITLSANLPGPLQSVGLKISGADTSKKDLLCMQINTSPATSDVSSEVPVLMPPLLAPAETGGSLKLAWNDCGGGSTPGTVKSLSPDVVVLGSKTTVTGSGTCSEDVPGGTFEIALKASIISQTYTGDLCSPKSFSLPLGTGTIAWDGVKCPIAAGTVDIPVDITLSANLPGPLQSVGLKISGADTSKKNLLCMQINTSPATSDVYSEVPALAPPLLAPAETGGSLKLAWNDCGGGSTPGTVKSLKPDVVVLGSKTTVTGSGTCSEDVPGGTFEIALKASIISQTYTGDLCSPKSFSLPLGTGTIAWDGVKCPIAAGTVDIPVDITLSANLPGPLQSVGLKISGADTSKKDLLCMQINTSPATSVVIV